MQFKHLENVLSSKMDEWDELMKTRISEKYAKVLIDTAIDMSNKTYNSKFQILTREIEDKIKSNNLNYDANFEKFDSGFKNIMSQISLFEDKLSKSPHFEDYEKLTIKINALEKSIYNEVTLFNRTLNSYEIKLVELQRTFVLINRKVKN